MKLMESACQPYNTGNETDPAQIWKIVDRLTPFELKRMAMALAFGKPARFEELLLEVWAARQP